MNREFLEKYSPIWEQMLRLANDTSEMFAALKVNDTRRATEKIDEVTERETKSIALLTIKYLGDPQGRAMLLLLAYAGREICCEVFKRAQEAEKPERENGDKQGII